MIVTGEQILARAESYVGNHEIPMGSNTGPFVEECQHDTFLAGTGWPWCAAHVCKVCKDEGVPLAYNGAGAHDLADHHTAISPAEAKPGDVCDWNIGSGHTSILKAKDDAAGIWTTVDGNWGNAVEVVEHPSSELRRVWRVPGVDDAKPTKPRKHLPPFVVATSHDGHRVILFRTESKHRLARWLLHHAVRKYPHGITISRAKRK